MNKSVTFSIVMPVYQVAKRFKLLVQALKSIEIQTYDRLEIIIVDDGSGDDTAKLVLAFIESNEWKYKHCTRLVISPNNAGVSVARNLGAMHATGDLIAFLDWDDLLFPRYVEKVVETFQNNPTTLAVLPSGLFYANFCGKEKARMLDVPADINTMKSPDFITYLLENNFPAPMGSGICLRSEVFREHKIEFDAYLSKKTAEDILFGYQLLENEIRPYFMLGEPIILVRAYLNVASRGRGAVLKDFEFDAFTYIRTRCADALIYQVKAHDEVSYVRVISKYALIQAAFEIKKTLLAEGISQAFVKSCKSIYLLKKYFYYLTFVKLAPLVSSSCYPRYVFFRTCNEAKSLATARNYLSQFD